MKLSFRLNREDARRAGIDDLLKLVHRYPDCFDEICFFTDLNEQCYENLDSFRTYALIFAEWMQKLREAGVPSVGLNILNTYGQGDDAWDWLESSPYQTVIGHDGKTTHGTICMRAPGAREYICEKYRIIASSHPDFIWVDDDMRITWHGVTYPCFCKHCLAQFSEKMGQSFTRESLVAALNDNKNEALRMAWIRFSADEMTELLRDASKAAHEVDPHIRFGLMTVNACEMYGYVNYDEMMRAMNADRLRPGGGYWTSDRPMEYHYKMINIADQIFQSAPVADVQYESETIPHIECKPQKIHAMEITASLFSGCTGAAIDNVMVVQDDYFARLLDTLRLYRPMWDVLTAHMQGWSLYGGAILQRRDAAAKIPTDNWFKNETRCVNRAYSFFEAGFSYTPDEACADYFIISGKMACVLKDEEIRRYLSGSVLMDGTAANILTSRGYGRLVGCASTGRTYTNGIREMFTDHPFNKNRKQYTRGGLQAQFRDGAGIYIADMLPGGEALTEVRSVTDVFCGYGSFLWENELGGRVAVLNYVPWTFSIQHERVHLLRNIVSWLSHGKPSVETPDAYHVTTHLRQPADRSGFALLLVRAWMDAAEPFRVRIRSSYQGAVRLYDSGSRQYTQVDAVNIDGICEFTVPTIGGWDFLIAVDSKESETV